MVERRKRIGYIAGKSPMRIAAHMTELDWDKYHNVIVRRLIQAKDKRELGQVSKQCGIPQSRFSEFMAGRRTINALYLMKFLKGGLVKVRDLTDVWTGGESKEERELILALRVFENQEFLSVLSQVEEQGLTDKALGILKMLVKKEEE